jgi:hypothetical protein
MYILNFFTCAEGNGNPCNAVLGPAPTKVEQYLFSANDNF